MALISLKDVSLGFGGPLLLDGIDLYVERGEWIGLLGRNGMGKTTLLKLLYGEILPENGQVSRQQNLSVAYLPQEIPPGLEGRVDQIIASGLPAPPATSNTDEAAWQGQLQIEKIISRMQLDPGAQFELLSAGLKRRVLLARGLVRSPKLLLLDEPTNHLDIESIDWLENFLKRWGGTLLFVTHDRVFLQRMATRIVELDRGRLFNWTCDYATFLSRKADLLAAEQTQNTLFDKKLAQEEQWIRRGILARGTRNEGRVRALQRLRRLRDERREQPGKVRLQIQADRRSGKLVIDAKDVKFVYPQRPILRDFSLTVQRGDRLGIIGPNGSGKTTLLRLLIAELAPQQGEVRHGTNLEIAYFDQLRDQLDESKSILDNVGQGGDTVTINGRTRSVIGYLDDFLFSPDRVQAPIQALSGGERNRLLLARLFARPTNLLVLDEPTNDLDIDTLEILEAMLLDYPGTLILVSHDRALLDNLVTSTLILNGEGQVTELVGGYTDWRQTQAEANSTQQTAPQPKKTAPPRQKTPSDAPRKLSYRKQRELEQLPGKIEALEAEQEQLNARVADPAFYQGDHTEVSRVVARLKTLETELAQVYQRWVELEE
jgi:ATP-binding cassette subfamily F protein uup